MVLEIKLIKYIDVIHCMFTDELTFNCWQTRLWPDILPGSLKVKKNGSLHCYTENTWCRGISLWWLNINGFFLYYKGFSVNGNQL